MKHVTNEWGAREGRCRHGFTCGCELSCVRTREHGLRACESHAVRSAHSVHVQYTVVRMVRTVCAPTADMHLVPQTWW